MLSNDDMDKPASLAEAMERRRVLIAEIEEIQAQLGWKGKRFKMASEEAYESWRSSAKWAVTNRLQELRFIKTYISEHSKGE